jgi:uncharacterized protein GlcG (DUF336 family)
MPEITLEQAQAVVNAALERARGMQLKMNIAVVDSGANLKAFARMDGAWLGSIDIAIRKARTARFFDMNTGELGKLSQPGQPLFNIEHSNGGLITFPAAFRSKQAPRSLARSAFPAARSRMTTPSQRRAPLPYKRESLKPTYCAIHAVRGRWKCATSIHRSGRA